MRLDNGRRNLKYRTCNLSAHNITAWLPRERGILGVKLARPAYLVGIHVLNKNS